MVDYSGSPWYNEALNPDEQFTTFKTWVKDTLISLGSSFGDFPVEQQDTFIKIKEDLEYDVVLYGELKSNFYTARDVAFGNFESQYQTDRAELAGSWQEAENSGSWIPI